MTGAWHRDPDPSPPSWELPALAGLVLLAVAAITPLLVQGVWVYVALGEFGWPADPVRALSGLRHGSFGVGLSPREVRGLPPVPVLVGLIGAAEVATLSTTVMVGLRLRRLAGHTGPGGERGLATRGGIGHHLGVSALRRRSHLIRPDLHPGRRGFPRPPWSRHREDHDKKGRRS